MILLDEKILKLLILIKREHRRNLKFKKIYIFLNFFIKIPGMENGVSYDFKLIDQLKVLLAKFAKFHSDFTRQWS